MSIRPWFAWFPADYRAKTAHLDYMQDSAYRRMIDAYYERRGPLPADPQALYRICSARTQDECEAIDYVSKQFFQNGDGVLRHGRCDEQIEKENELHKAWVRAGRKGGLSKARGRLEPGSTIPSPSPSPHSSLHLHPDPQPSDGDVVCYIPLNTSAEFPVTKPFLTELEKAYPAVDGPQTLLEIRAWCLANPTKRKTKRGVLRFINSWFERTQNG